MKQGIHAQILKSVQVIVVLLCIAVFFIPHTSHGAVGINAQIPFSGILRDASGTEVDGTEDMLFKIYDAPTGGTLLWTGTHTAGNGNVVNVEDGSFSVLLGSGTGNTLTLDFNDDTYYLGVTVGADTEMTPRERLGASGYAVNSNLLDGLDASAFVQSNAPITIATTTASELLILDQEGAGDLLRLVSGGTDVLSILNNGALNVMSPDNSTFAGNIQFTDGSGVYLGSIDDAVGGLSLYMNTTDPALGSNVLMIGMHGDAALNNAVDITTPGSLSLNANSMNGPGISLNATDGNVSLWTPSSAINTFSVGAVLQLPNFAGSPTDIAVDNFGNVIAGGSSDERLKQNITTIDDALEIVLNLRGVRYEWKDAERFGSQPEVGFIAQEVESVLPEVVRTGGEYLTINYKNIVAVVVEAIKELTVKVENYFARTEQLEIEVADLRAEIELLKQKNTTPTQEVVPELVPQAQEVIVEQTPITETQAVNAEESITETTIPTISLEGVSI